MSNQIDIVPRIVAIGAGAAGNECWVACSDNSLWHLYSATTQASPPQFSPTRDPGTPWIWEKIPPIPFPASGSGYSGYGAGS
jgi:hypothetical protein